LNKVKLSDLIAKADQKKAKHKKRKELYVKSLDGTIIVEKPDRALILDAFDMDQEGNCYLIYECTIEPNLKDASLHAAYGCIKPMDIIDAIFEPGEIARISGEIVKMAGYDEDSVRMVEEIKN